MKWIIFLVISIFIGSSFGASVHAEEAPACSMIIDERMDVEVTSATGSTPYATERADLVSASLLKTADGFLASASTSAPFRMSSKEKGNVVFMFDADANEDNNSRSVADVRGGSDLHYLLYPRQSSSTPWGVRRYVFIRETGSWRRTQTSSTPDVTDAYVGIRIPNAELTLVDPVRWRAWISVGESAGWAARDGAPTRSTEPGTCAYLPFPSSSNPGTTVASSTTSEPTADLLPGVIAVLIGLALAGFQSLVGRFRR